MKLYIYLTVYQYLKDSDWEGKYMSLEKYAYSLYVNKFSDEQHFLIVYSKPDDADTSDFVDWSWEGMQGDDTDNILTEVAMDIFNDDLEKYLTMDSVTTDNAFIKTFDHSMDYLMSAKTKNPDSLMIVVFALIWTLAIVSIIIKTIQSYIISQREYYADPENEQCPVEIMK